MDSPEGPAVPSQPAVAHGGGGGPGREPGVGDLRPHRHHRRRLRPGRRRRRPRSTWWCGPAPSSPPRPPPSPSGRRCRSRSSTPSPPSPASRRCGARSWASPSLVDKDGKAINPSGLPTVGTSFSPGDTLVAGRAPAGPGEVVIDDVTVGQGRVPAGRPDQDPVPGPGPGVHHRRRAQGQRPARLDHGQLRPGDGPAAPRRGGNARRHPGEGGGRRVARAHAGPHRRRPPRALRGGHLRPGGPGGARSRGPRPSASSPPPCSCSPRWPCSSAPSSSSTPSRSSSPSGPGSSACCGRSAPAAATW